MGAQSVNYTCPACNGAVRFASELGSVACDFCGSVFSVEEIERLHAAKQEKADNDVLAGSAAWGAEQQGQPLDYTAYSCSSCGAELVCEPTTAISECPYCGNQAVAPGRVDGEFRPDCLIPFAKDKNHATSALAEFYKHKMLLPRSFTEHNRLEKIQGVYVPFWLYDVSSDGEGTYKAENKRTYRRGDEEITETDRYACTRSGSARFERIPVDASTSMPDGHMDAIEPYDYGALTDFSVAYLPGFAADRYDQSSDECSERATQRAENSLESELRGTVKGYDSVSKETFHAQSTVDNASYAMLPVWLLNTVWNDKSFLFAMNGQTGKLVGDLPVSKVKGLLWFLGVFVVSAAALLGCAFGLGWFPDDQTMRIVVPVAGALVIAALVLLILVGQMKTAHTQSAARQYLQDGSFELTRSADQFLGTTTTRKHIEKNS